MSLNSLGYKIPDDGISLIVHLSCFVIHRVKGKGDCGPETPVSSFIWLLQVDATFYELKESDSHSADLFLEFSHPEYLFLSSDSEDLLGQQQINMLGSARLD